MIRIVNFSKYIYQKYKDQTEPFKHRRTIKIKSIGIKIKKYKNSSSI